MPKISILIPIYNVEHYLKKCLESAVHQTEKDLEIICVEDASTDSSLKIVNEYAKKDSRIKLLLHKKNEGLCQTRKDAVLAATGEYIMFLDSDDYLDLNACECLYEIITKKKVDFIQFGTTLLANDGVSQSMVEWVDNFMKPTNERLENCELLTECFINGKFNCNLVNKIWRTECCKKAYGEIDDGNYVSAEDRYAVFILAYYAKSCEGIQNKYYNYRLGTGVTGGDILDLERFEKRCKGAVIVENIKRFLKEKDVFERYNKEYEAFYKDILWDCVDCWYNKLMCKDYGKAYDILLKYWKPEQIVGAIARVYFEQETEIEKKVKNSKAVLKKNIGIYCRYLEDMALFKHIIQQIEELKVTGNQIVLFLDEDLPSIKNEKFYQDNQICFLPSSKEANWDKYSLRAEVFSKQASNYNIGYIFYTSPASHIAWLDVLLLKSMRIEVLYMDKNIIGRLDKRSNLKLFGILQRIKRFVRIICNCKGIGGTYVKKKRNTIS